MSALDQINAVLEKRKETLEACHLEMNYTENDLETLALVSIAESLAGIDISLGRLADATDAEADDDMAAKVRDIYKGADPA